MEVADDFVTENMFWASRTNTFDHSKYIEQLRSFGIDNDAELHEIADRLCSEVAQELCDLAEFPTWNILSTRKLDSQFYIEMGMDYRIDDWMKKHSREYGVKYHGEKAW